MTELFRVTAPLALRCPDGVRKLIAECFPHPSGLLYLDIFWHQSTPDQAAHLIHGELKGEGPWKIGDCVISVLGCQGTDPELQATYARWRDYLRESGQREYPSPEQIRDIARKLGAFA
jgi:hypothetical protein